MPADIYRLLSENSGADDQEIKNFGAIPIGRYKSKFTDFLKIEEIIKITLI